MTGKGSLAGIADDVLNITKRNRLQWEETERLKLMRTVEMRDYKRQSRSRQVKRMTAAMMDIIQYVKHKPGAQRRELLERALGGRIISPSSLGGSLKALVDQGILETNGFTVNRKFYIKGSKHD